MMSLIVLSIRELLKKYQNAMQYKCSEDFNAQLHIRGAMTQHLTFGIITTNLKNRTIYIYEG